jgi:hypothetical protein
MPTPFPSYDEATDSLIDRDYYDVDEVAAMLHVSVSTVHRRIIDGRWHALHVGHARYMSAAQVGEAVDSMRTGATVREPDPPKLGEPVGDVDLESLR